MCIRDRHYMFAQKSLSPRDSVRAIRLAAAKSYDIDTLYNRLPLAQRQQALMAAQSRVSQAVQDLDFKSMITSDGDWIIRQHKIEAINKFTMALSCLIFFFIGAPLGAIIRKGGLGIPVIISVLVFIIYYILDNTGYRMARGGMWAIWFGKGLAMGVLTPVAVFVTYKASNDSMVFNLDLYRELFMKLLGLRLKRHVFGKEVIIQDPDYNRDSLLLQKVSEEVTEYARSHRLVSVPNIIKVFFRYHPDHEIERISGVLEDVIEDLNNTRDKAILTYLNLYPVVSVKAHTRPFERRWQNILSFIAIPLGLVLYFRMWMFRIRLLRDLRTIKQTNTYIINRIKEINQ